MCGGGVRFNQMGRYIDDILQPGEKVLYSTNAHWIFYLPAIATWIVAAILVAASGLVLVPVLTLLCWATAAVVAGLREHVAGPGSDRFLAPEIEAAVDYVASGAAVRAAETVTGPFQ